METVRDSRIKETPVKENDEIKEICISIGKKGDGIFKVKGFVVIVPDAKRGKSYNIRITKVLSRIGFGEIIE